ncbi:hypothetical protein BTVI_08759 [Pitangus sulphuratus]|nr:hypothetical protein BTVI_08759 [Pitangus sulphuratus]
MEAIVKQESYDAVPITEMWWDDIQEWSAAMDVYKLFRKDRQGRRASGVARYVKECFKRIELKASDDKIECLWSFKTKAGMSLVVTYKIQGFNEVKYIDFVLLMVATGQEEGPRGPSVSLTSIPGNVMEHLILESISIIYMENKKVIRSSQRGFTKGKSCLTNLIAFYDKTTTWRNDEGAVDAVYFNFSKAFDMVSHNILTGKLKKCV